MTPFAAIARALFLSDTKTSSEVANHSCETRTNEAYLGIVHSLTPTELVYAGGLSRQQLRSRLAMCMAARNVSWMTRSELLY